MATMASAKAKAYRAAIKQGYSVSEAECAAGVLDDRQAYVRDCGTITSSGGVELNADVHLYADGSYLLVAYKTPSSLYPGLTEARVMRRKVDIQQAKIALCGPRAAWDFAGAVPPIQKARPRRVVVREAVGF